MKLTQHARLNTKQHDQFIGGQDSSMCTIPLSGVCTGVNANKGPTRGPAMYVGFYYFKLPVDFSMYYASSNVPAQDFSSVHVLTFSIIERVIVTGL